MASIIDHRCGTQLYLMESEDIAKKCGSVGGFIAAFVITIFICCLSSVIIFIYGKKAFLNDLTPEEEKNKTKNQIIVGTCLICTCFLIVIVWISLPLISGLTNSVTWKSKQAQIEAYENQGFSRKEAIAQVQSMHETQITANAYKTPRYSNRVTPLQSRRNRIL